MRISLKLCVPAFAFAMSALPAVAAPAPPASETIALDGVPAKGDHYLCYDTNLPVSIDVALQDQFGQFKFHAYQITRLCNPVVKIYKGKTTEIKNPDLHYVCYRGKTTTATHVVLINNQFGQQQLKVTGPTELCLPSVKKRLD